MKSNSYTNIRKSVIVHNLAKSERRFSDVAIIMYNNRFPNVKCRNLISQIPQIRNLVSFLF